MRKRRTGLGQGTAKGNFLKLSPLSVAVIGSIFSVVTALLGAWVGAKWGFDRYKQERAFERRIIWYEDTVSALVELSASEQAYGDANTTDIQKLERLQTQINERWRTANDLIARRGLYAKQRGYDAIEAMITEEMIASADDKTNTPQEMAEIFRRVADTLTAELREDLGWDIIDKERFIPFRWPKGATLPHNSATPTPTP
ncbi:MAG: hypothetical protein WAO00_10965 [Chthoniobacterales bacterium]